MVVVGIVVVVVEGPQLRQGDGQGHKKLNLMKLLRVQPNTANVCDSIFFTSHIYGIHLCCFEVQDNYLPYHHALRRTLSTMHLMQISPGNKFFLKPEGPNQPTLFISVNNYMLCAYLPLLQQCVYKYSPGQKVPYIETF